MSLKAKRKPANNIPPVDGGTYMAVCIGVIDLGEQYQQYEKQKQGKYVNQCMFIFEIPSERVQVDGEDKPRWLSTKPMTVSMHERSTLIQMLTSWRGHPLSESELDPSDKSFDLIQMLGVGAMLSVSVVEKDDGSRHNKIEAITGLPKGIDAPQVESEPLFFDADEPDMDMLEKLPKWIQDIIRKSTQFAENPPDEKIQDENTGADPAGEECPI